MRLYRWQWKGLSSKNFESLSSLLSVPERESLSSLSREKRKLEFLTSRILLRRVFAEHFGQILPRDLGVSETGKPFVEDVEPFNWSHCSGVTFLGVSGTSSIGVDVQLNDTNRDILKLVEFYGSNWEKKTFSALETSKARAYFFKTWSLKEAYAKCSGDGISTNLSQLDLRGKSSLDDERKNCFIYFRIENFHYAACVDSALGPEIHIFDVLLEDGDLVMISTQIPFERL